MPQGTTDDRLAIPPLESRGWHVDVLSWRAAADWSAYDAVLIRSTWDYHRDPDTFLQVLGEIDRSGAGLLNPLALVRWNARKSYLRELDSLGVATVPTVWRERLEVGELASLFEELAADDVIVKPVVSASAEGTARIDRHAPIACVRQIEAQFATRAVMAQPVARAVLDEGEFSLIYLGGAFSHAVRKTPRLGDFRVQEEHGGTIRTAEAEATLLNAGEAVIAALPEVPLYARVDIVRANDLAGWWLMELELIEPTLYLGMSPGAPERFARALDGRIQTRRASARGRSEAST
jgi:glutathione synthase/RimK-type ligase-like ATP-grasp enzyme